MFTYFKYIVFITIWTANFQYSASVKDKQCNINMVCNHLFFFFYRESIYRLLPQTTAENIAKNFDQYTIDPGTRYPNLNCCNVRPHQVRGRARNYIFTPCFWLIASKFPINHCSRCVIYTSEES